MFDDFFSSARGPGLIGMLLALIVVVGLCALFMSASTSGPSLETEVRQQRALITSTTRNIESTEKEVYKMKGYQEVRAKLDGQEKILSTKKTAIAEAKEAYVGITKATSELLAKHHKYRQRYRDAERARAEGEKIDLSSSMGDLYKEVTISRVDPIEMGVKTRSGPKRVPWKQLPPAVQDRFQFDAIEAEAHREELRMASKQQDKAIAAAQVVRGEQKKADEEQKTERQREMDEVKVQNLLLAAESKKAEAKNLRRQARDARNQHMEARRRGNSSMHLGKANEYEKKATAADDMSRRYIEAANRLEAKLNSSR